MVTAALGDELGAGPGFPQLVLPGGWGQGLSPQPVLVGSLIPPQWDRGAHTVSGSEVTLSRGPTPPLSREADRGLSVLLCEPVATQESFRWAPGRRGEPGWFAGAGTWGAQVSLGGIWVLEGLCLSTVVFPFPSAQGGAARPPVLQAVTLGPAEGPKELCED